MDCPACNSGEIISKTRSYKCSNCGFTLHKRIADVFITPDLIDELAKHGCTRVINNFYSYKNRRQFSASLALDNDRVVFRYPRQKEAEKKPGPSNPKKCHLRVQANNSGSVYMSLNGAIKKHIEINYGLAPVPLTELYGCLTGIQLIKYHQPALKDVKLEISINNKNTAQYILKEKTPRKKEVKNALNCLQSLLQNFTEWEAYYQPKKRPKLTGGQKNVKFPPGAFPWLNAGVTHEKNSLTVTLPNSPDLIAQFKTSLYKAEQLDKNTFKLPPTAEDALNAWLVTVKNGAREKNKTRG